MASPSLIPVFPPEIFQTIIESLLWINRGHVPIALPATSIITKTLLTLTYTSRRTYYNAMKHLYEHCLYIDAPWRLTRLLDTLWLHNKASTIMHSPLRLSFPSIRNITSLYLSPFENLKLTHTDLLQLRPMVELLTLLAPSLERLVLDTQESFRFDVYFALQPVLTTLHSLEVFCSVSDELHMTPRGVPTKDDSIWMHWPNLRILSLRGATPHIYHWKWWGEMEFLESLIFVEEWVTSLSDYQPDWKVWNAEWKKEKMEITYVVREQLHGHPFTGGPEGKEGDTLVEKTLVVPGQEGDYPIFQPVGHWVGYRLLEGYEDLDCEEVVRAFPGRKGDGEMQWFMGVRDGEDA